MGLFSFLSHEFVFNIVSTWEPGAEELQVTVLDSFLPRYHPTINLSFFVIIHLSIYSDELGFSPLKNGDPTLAQAHNVCFLT